MKRILLWIVFLLYVAVSGFTMTRHEPWTDELHSWNIARGSGSYAELVFNRRYEGHPPGWHTALWCVSKCTHNVHGMQALQWALSCAVVFVLLFAAPLPDTIKILLPFGYFFLFEYAVFSRNYMLGICCAFCICAIIRKEFRYKPLLYYAMLFCLSNVHMLALLLGCCLHLYFLLFNLEQRKKTGAVVLHGLCGVLVMLPALYWIQMPADAGIEGPSFSTGRFLSALDAPLRAFMPVPAWWNAHWWNTQFLLDATGNSGVVRGLCMLVSAGLIALAFFVLRKNKKSMVLFGVNTLLILLLGTLALGLDSTRYTGFIFIGFIAALWLHCYETPVTTGSRHIVTALLLVQLAAGVFAVVKDIRLPFSHLGKVNELLARVPAGQQWVTDYWTMNTVVAYTDKPAYCVDMQEPLSFVTWGPDLKRLKSYEHRYTEGIELVFRQRGIQSIYMISLAPPAMLHEGDSLADASFHISLVDKREGAIEKGSNLYLYRISAL